MPRRTFAERLPEVAAASARTTARLRETHRFIGQALGGQAGARLAASLGMPTSPDSRLRRGRRAPLSQRPAVRVLGVDDWAWTKGQRYGTILCDLERRRPVDLLPQRSADSLASWLKAHPGVEIISRDRGDESIKGANRGAPEAVQVADRWHLLLNLQEALMRAVDRHHGHVLEAAKAVAASQEPEPLPAKTPKGEPAGRFSKFANIRLMSFPENGEHPVTARRRSGMSRLIHPPSASWSLKGDPGESEASKGRDAVFCR